MVMGAGWAGARAATTTSGPGMSLMSEWAGMSYYAEIPGVIWNVQRVGPSTGMPTRTMQADLLAAYTLSHGDTRHPILLPANPDECFEFGQACFDLAERLQTLVFVLSDLDLGMNLFTSKKFSEPTKPFDRGKVLTERDFETRTTPFYRYADVDNDGIPERTVPGTRSPAAQWLARGSGHNFKGQYTEKPDEYLQVVDRLKKKFETAKTFVPHPIISSSATLQAAPSVLTALTEAGRTPASPTVGIIAFGSSDFPMKEARDQLLSGGIDTAYLRVRALPMSTEVFDFIKSHDRIYVVEQNRDGQLRNILEMEVPRLSSKLESVLHYDGLPLYASKISSAILNSEQRSDKSPRAPERTASTV
jgi:2-oxoglutarate ferredoxin oxidoreductase subunit alpha